MVEKLKQHRAQRPREREDGLALLDVLIGMAIFALIAVIAVSAISQYRSRANFTALLSDAEHVRIAAEQHYTDEQTFPVLDPSGYAVHISGVLENPAFSTFLSDYGVTLTKGVHTDYVYWTDYGLLYPQNPTVAGFKMFKVCLVHLDGGVIVLDWAHLWGTQQFIRVASREWQGGCDTGTGPEESVFSY